MFGLSLSGMKFKEQLLELKLNSYMDSQDRQDVGGE
jgi:hypothetical protein